MTAFKKTVIISTLTFATIVVLIASTDYVMPWNRLNAIESTLKWGGLAPLPDDLSDLTVKTKGGPFTRQFVVSFYSSPSSILDWINRSSRLRSLNMSSTNITADSFDIHPGDSGALGGTVTVDRIKGAVTIVMSWS